jgi:class 3 adenylate cyclase/tetratricopeptide (TPR) repeat protein
MLACPECGAETSPGKKFCRACGTALSGRVPDRPLSPASYTPKHLAEKILTSKAALEGERKQVTVLFADLKGSMELLADRDPEEARTLLDPVLERMMAAVHRYEGTVNQVMGDGIMALFGAPLAHEDHAVRACYAALDMQAAIRQYAERARSAYDVTPQIRVGLNSGEVVVRAIGSDLRMDYTAVGQTTHLAARMEQLAAPGTTRLTAGTLQLAEGYLEVRPLGAVPVKGLEGPVEVYELVGAGSRRSRLHAAEARGLTPFVSRSLELEVFRQALSQAAAGHGQIVAIVGEPGVGKSRLVWEVMHSHRLHGWTALQADGVSYGKATPYLPIIGLLKSYFDVQDRADARAIRDKILGKVLTLDEDLQSIVPALETLLDMPVEDTRWNALDPLQRRRLTLDGVKRLILRESRVQPVLLVVEDLHWIDAESQAVLDVLVESLPASPVLLLLTYRPEYQHRWGSKTYYRQLRLDPLTPEGASELLDALVGRDASLDRLRSLVIDRTEGNPFFLEESVRTWVERRALLGERGDYRLAGGAPDVRIPATVHAVLAARIDRLPSEHKRVLQAAAVVGMVVSWPLLKAVADIPEAELKATLAGLQAGEFLYETRPGPELEFGFKHPLTYEVAYGSMLQDRRRALHARVVETLEGLQTGGPTEPVEQLAHHALRAERWEQAVACLRRASAKAAFRAANREALAFLEAALDALRHLPEDRHVLEQGVDIRFEVRNALFQLRDFDRTFTYLQECQPIIERLGDRARLGALSSYLTQHFVRVDLLNEAIEAGRRAVAIAEEVGDTTLQGFTIENLGYAHVIRGDYAVASDLFRRNVAIFGRQRLRERMGNTFHAVYSRAWLAFALGLRGEFVEGRARGEEGVQFADETEQLFSQVTARYGLGTLLVELGDVPAAVLTLERAHALAESGTLLFGAAVRATLARAYALAGRFEESLALVEGISTLKFDKGGMAILWTLSSSEAYLMAGRVPDALRLARRGLERTQHAQQRGLEAWAFRLIADANSQGDAPEVVHAADHYQMALNLAWELGMRPLVAHCHLGLGKLYRRTGDDAKTQEHLATAKAMYREMDMGFYSAQADTVGAGGDP